MRALVRALPDQAALVLVLADSISCGTGKSALTEVFRQAAKNRTIVNAHRINLAPTPPPLGTADDFNPR
jgi:hypothetical protein